MAGGVFQRGGWWHFRIRRPRRFEAVEPRALVTVSLHTDSEREARAKAPAVAAGLLAMWEARAAGRDGDAAARHAAAVKLAAARGFDWRPAEALEAGAFGELVARMIALAGGGVFEAETARAILGVDAPPALTVTQALEAFFAETTDRLQGRSDKQRRKWREPRRRAVRRFVALRGDRPFAEIDAADAVAFRAALRGRVERGEVTAAFGNKEIGYMADLWAVVAETRGLAGPNPFAGRRLHAAPDGRRPSLSRDQVRAILAGLDGLNPEAADVVRIMALTGAGFAEVVEARVEDLETAADPPRLAIVAHPGRRLKTPHRGRRIPLFGAALEAAKARRAAGGFPRYRARPDALSAAVNKYLRGRGLLPGGASAGSLRHAFQDRLIAAELPERLQADLMGHKLARPRYGEGPTMEQLAEWMARALP